MALPLQQIESGCMGRILPNYEGLSVSRSKVMAGCSWGHRLLSATVSLTLTKNKIAKKKKYCFFLLFDFLLEKVE